MPDSIINYTAAGWPYLDANNYVETIPAYTDELAHHLGNAVASANLARSIAGPGRLWQPPVATPLQTFNNTGSTQLTRTDEGTLQHWTRPAVPKPLDEWSYVMLAYDLGTVADLADMRVQTYWEPTSPASAPGFGTSPTSWPSWRPAQQETGTWVEYDMAAIIAAKGWTAGQHVYWVMGFDLTAGGVFDAIDWTTGVLLTPKGEPDSILIADAIRPAPQAPPTITCWGDSLTAGGGWTETLADNLGTVVHNAGTGGENARTIMARQGADVMIVNNLTIPAGASPVTIASRATDTGILTAAGHRVTPLLQWGPDHFNPVTIAGVEGTLAWTGTSHTDPNGTWTFTRATPGAAVTIDRPTAILTKADRERNDADISIVFMGTNGGYTDVAELVNQHRLMAAHHRGRHFIALGLSFGTAVERADYEAAMADAFGRYFIPLRPYLAAYGLADAGLVATQADLDAMAVGKVPPQLLTDAVHYTAATRTVIGHYLTRQLQELGIV